MVRKTKTVDEPIERTRDVALSPEELRAPHRASVYANTTVRNTDVTREIITREIIARVDADFERIFGSE